MAAYVDDMCVELNGEVYSQTIRTSQCDIIGHSMKCSSCGSYRANLCSMLHRWNKRKSNDQPLNSTTESSCDSSKFTNDRYLNTPEKVAKIDDLRKRARNAEQTVVKLREKIRTLTQEQGEVLDESFNSDLLHIMQENSDDVKRTYPKGSFARLFWDEQIKAATASNPRGIRWHPVTIKWLKLMSSSSYHALRTSGFVKLPSERTLRDYTHYFENRLGFQDEVNDQLMNEIERMTLPPERKYVALLINKMKSKGLVYNGGNCRIHQHRRH